MEPELFPAYDLDEALADLGIPSKEDRTDPQLPAQMQVFDRGSHIEFVRKWSACSGQVGILGAAMFWAVLALLANNFKVELEELGATGIVLVALCAGASIAVTYALIALSVNQTHIIVSRDMIRVRHKPLPWVGNREMGTSNLKRLHAEDRAGYYRRRGYRVTYEVHAVTRDGQSVKLVGDLTCDQARYIEHQAEKYLGIEDVAVGGFLAYRNGGCESNGTRTFPGPERR